MLLKWYYIMAYIYIHIYTPVWLREHIYVKGNPKHYVMRWL
jgi:hypothetical protein